MQRSFLLTVPGGDEPHPYGGIVIVGYYAEHKFCLVARELFERTQKNEHEICVPVWCHEQVRGVHQLRPRLLDQIREGFPEGRLEGVRWIIPSSPSADQQQCLQKIAEQYGCVLVAEIRTEKQYQFELFLIRKG